MTKSSPETENAEITETSANVLPATLTSAAPTLTLAGGMKIRLVRAVSRPVLTHKPNTSVFIQIVEPVESKLTTEKTTVVEKGEKREVETEREIRVVNVLNLETGQEMSYVVNAVTDSELTEKYPDFGYVGKCYAIMKGGKRDGKNFNDIFISEVEVEA